MADVYAIFGTLLALGIAFPGMLSAWWLLFPRTVEGARLRIHHTPWRAFWMGLAILFVAGIPIFILIALPFGPAKFVGATLAFLILAVASLGAAGIAAEMGDRLGSKRGDQLSATGAFIRAAVALELAAAFPLVGWFIVIPLTVIVSIGATTFALLGWIPRPALPLAPDVSPTQV